MKPFVGLATIGAVILALVGTGRAANQTVTFQVPLKLQNIHPMFTMVKVECSLRGKSGGVVTLKSVFVPLTGGRYDGPPVAVAVTATDAQATLIVGWHCQFDLRPNATSAGTSPSNDASSPAGAKAGTPLVFNVDGSF